MHQVYHTKHNHTQKVALDITATTLVANNLVCLNNNLGKSISVEDETYLFNAAITGIAGITGFYIARHATPVHGFPSMVSVASFAATLTGLPPDSVLMGFHTYVDLSTGANLPIADASITWFPVEYGTNTLDHTATPAKMNVSVQQVFAVENDRTNAQYFGIACFGTWTAAARTILGAASLRQVTSEIPLFNPNK